MTRTYELPIYKIQLIKDGNQISNRKQVTSPTVAADILKEMLSNQDREHFVIVLLNKKNHITGINTVSIGSLDASIIHPREVIKPAILANAAAVIFAHNHPSGDPTPSNEDQTITKHLKNALDLMAIEVKDHIIIGENCFFSFKEKGMI